MKVNITLLLQHIEDNGANTIEVIFLRDIRLPFAPSVGLVLEMLPIAPSSDCLEGPDYARSEFTGTYAIRCDTVRFEINEMHYKVRCCDARKGPFASFKKASEMLTAIYGFRVLYIDQETKERLNNVA